MHLLPLLVLGLLLQAGFTSAAQQGDECPIKGDVIWWTADFCMAHLETDDEIAASDCIAAEMAQHSGSPCTAKTHYKQQLCRLAIARGTLQSSVEKCVADPLFHGSTVRDRGVGR